MVIEMGAIFGIGIDLLFTQPDDCTIVFADKKLNILIVGFTLDMGERIGSRIFMLS